MATEALPKELEEQQSLVRQTQLLQVMTGLPVADAIGACCSYLLHCAYKHRVELRRVLNESIVREGFRGTKLIEELVRIARS